MAIELGETEQETAGAGLVTVTVVCALAVPPAPVQVRVYVLLAVGETFAVPPVEESAPTPWSILEEVEPVQEAVRVEELPLVMLVGEAVRLAVGAVAPGTV